MKCVLRAKCYYLNLFCIVLLEMYCVVSAMLSYPIGTFPFCTIYWNYKEWFFGESHNDSSMSYAIFYILLYNVL